jgi:hypothetical protein
LKLVFKSWSDLDSAAANGEYSLPPLDVVEIGIVVI